MGEEREETSPLILSVDTATAVRSVAVVGRGETLSLVRDDARRQGSSAVLSDVDEALRRAGVALSDVELFAVAAGPGSFTGLRAGLATVKAFAATLGRPAVAVPTLHAVAHAARPARRLIALIPAGRGEFFAQLLSVTEGGDVEESGRAAHVAPRKILEIAAGLEGPLTWAGQGAHALGDEIRAAAASLGVDFTDAGDDAGGSGARVWSLAPHAGEIATHVASLALKEYVRGRAGSAEELKAIYVRASDAELSERCQPQGQQTSEG